MTSGSDSSLSVHLEALRGMLIRCFVAVGILFPVCFYLSLHAIDWLKRWSCPPEIGELAYLTPMEPLIAQLKLGLVLALVCAFPYCAWQVWRFLMPALYESERRTLKWWVLSATVLFAVGATFCLLVIVPLMMQFSAGFATEGLRPVISLGHFLELTGWMTLAFGLMFQFPLCVLLVVRFGLITPQSLAAKRPYVVVGIFMLSALLTPPDIVSQCALALPTWALFELALFLARYMAPPPEPEFDDFSDEPHPPDDDDDINSDDSGNPDPEPSAPTVMLPPPKLPVVEPEATPAVRVEEVSEPESEYFPKDDLFGNAFYEDEYQR